ncbi:MAG: hypothetical protein AAFN27_07690 [Pseudomonadota bacterium]
MAVVRKFVKGERAIKSLQPTQVECLYIRGEIDGNRILQIDTYGSQHREKPGKQSQTLQFTEESARDLWQILRKEFGFK